MASSQNNQSNARRTQAERRAQTYQQVLESACRLFGEQGYANTSLDDIANDCGLTTRPIYHYFGNKKALFAAVNELMEQRILDSMSDAKAPVSIQADWDAFTALCDDAHFRQIVLIDSPNVLGKERWATSAVTQKALDHFKTSKRGDAKFYRQQLFSRMLMGAFSEAAQFIAQADDIKTAKREARQLIAGMFSHES